MLLYEFALSVCSLERPKRGGLILEKVLYVIPNLLGRANYTKARRRCGSTTCSPSPPWSGNARQQPQKIGAELSFMTLARSATSCRRSQSLGGARIRPDETGRTRK